jgi:hypothetical protein
MAAPRLPAGTEPGVQVDSSVALLLVALVMAPELVFRASVLVDLVDTGRCLTAP